MKTILRLFLFMTSLVLVGQEARIANFNINDAKVKIFLKEDEDIFRDLPVGAAQKLLEMYGQVGNSVKSELWIGDRKMLDKMSRGEQLTQKEDASITRCMILGFDGRLSVSELRATKLSLLDRFSDSKSIGDSHRKIADRIKNAGIDAAAYDSAQLEAAKNIGKTMRLVSETNRHFTIVGDMPDYSTFISYVIAEGKPVMIIVWSDPARKDESEKRMAEIVDLIEKQTREWDGVIPDFSNSRFNGPDSLFSYKCYDKWESAAFRGQTSPFAPGAKFVFLRHPHKNKAGNSPLISFVLEKAPYASVTEFWSLSQRDLATKVAEGSIQSLSEARSYPMACGWPAMTVSYQFKAESPVNCRIVLLMVGPNQFLTATLLYDDTVSAEVISAGVECIDSLDTPDSPKRKAFR